MHKLPLVLAAFGVLCIFIIQFFFDNSYNLKLPKHLGKPLQTENLYFTKAEFELGKLLFFDPILSKDSTISCASCHNYALSFTDGNRQAFGVLQRKGTRNVPPLINMAWSPYFFAEGGVKTLEQQVLAPLSNSHEMDLPIWKAIERLKANAFYSQYFNRKLKSDPNSYNITRAIAAFEKTIISANSPYDQYVRGEKNALTQSQIRGMHLFLDPKNKCSICHKPPLFTDFKFYNIGVEKYNIYDLGKMIVSENKADSGSFKTPTLRNVALTAPYMHNGSIKTLNQVMNHYNIGGKLNANKNLLIQPLNLSKNEITDIVNFLKSLTDTTGYTFLYRN